VVPAGAVAVRVVGEVTLTPVARVVPKDTVVPDEVNPLPLTVTVVPPVDGPYQGLTAVSVGATAAGVGLVGDGVGLNVGDGVGLNVGDGVGENVGDCDGLGLNVGEGLDDGLPHVRTTGVATACVLLPALVPSSTCAT
jgi:hypothetical protein